MTTTEASIDMRQTVGERLVELHRLLAELLIEIMEDKENPPNAAMLRVVVAFLKDNGIACDANTALQDAQDMMQKMLDDLPTFPDMDNSGSAGRSDQ